MKGGGNLEKKKSFQREKEELLGRGPFPEEMGKFPRVMKMEEKQQRKRGSTNFKSFD